jgi:hypothetical protein
VPEQTPPIARATSNHCNREGIRSLTSRIQIWDNDCGKRTQKNAVTKA